MPHLKVSQTVLVESETGNDYMKGDSFIMTTVDDQFIVTTLDGRKWVVDEVTTAGHCTHFWIKKLETLPR